MIINNDLNPEHFLSSSLVKDSKSQNTMSNNIWEGDNIKKLSKEELHKFFWGLTYGDDASVIQVLSNEQTVEEVAEQNKSDKEEVLSPEFNLSLFDENITEKDILEESKKYSVSKIPPKHSDIMNRLLTEIEEVDFEEKAGIKGTDKVVSLKMALVLIVESLINTAIIKGWNICKNNFQIHVYNGAYWSIIDREPFEAFLGAVANKMGIGKLTANYYVFREKLFKQFMAVAFFERPAPSHKKVLINFLNGTFEISMEKQELREHRSEDFLCYQLPFPYDPFATSPLFMDYLNYALPQDNKLVQDVLSEFMGYVFIDSENLKLEKALLLFGSGANGKSVFFEVMYHMYGGSENVSSFSSHSLTDNTGYYRAAFAYKLLNYASEISSKMNISLFKALTSGEPVEARIVYNPPYMLTNYGKLAFNCNELPKDVEFTNAFFRRFLIIPFEQTVPEDKQDKELANKIVTAELPGVFNWVIAGLNRLLKQRKFTYSVAVENALESYKKQSDNVSLFIEDGGYEKSVSHSIPLKELYDLYKVFCHESGYRACSLKTFSDRLRALNYDFERKSKGNFVFISNEFVRTLGFEVM